MLLGKKSTQNASHWNEASRQGGMKASRLFSQEPLILVILPITASDPHFSFLSVQSGALGRKDQKETGKMSDWLSAWRNWGWWGGGQCEPKITHLEHRAPRTPIPQKRKDSNPYVSEQTRDANLRSAPGAASGPSRKLTTGPWVVNISRKAWSKEYSEKYEAGNDGGIRYLEWKMRGRGVRGK